MPKGSVASNSRKDNGDGCIYQISENEWRAIIHLGGKKSNGRPNVKQFSSKTERGVRKKLSDFKKTRGLEKSTAIQIVTVEQYFTDWLYTVKFYELKPSSFDRLESTIKNHIIPEFGDLQLHDLSDEKIKAYFSLKLKAKASYSTVKKIYDAINACLKYAIIRRDFTSINPMALIKPPSKNKFSVSDIVILTDDEVVLMLNELDRIYKTGVPVYIYAEAYKVLLYSGIRVGELLALKWSEIDLDSRIMKIKKNVVIVKSRSNDDPSKTDGYISIEQDSTKTDAGTRVLHINQKAYNALNKLRNNTAQSGYVVCNSKWNPVPVHNYERTFSRIMENCHINKSGTHLLRHTFASRMFRHNVDVKTVSEILGHSSVQITYNTYIHLIQEQKVKAIDVMDVFD